MLRSIYFWCPCLTLGRSKTEQINKEDSHFQAKERTLEHYRNILPIAQVIAPNNKKDKYT
jgi:hypothetical protein